MSFVVDKLEDVYSSSIEKHEERCKTIVRTFKERYGVPPLFLSRSPGRVNIVGEHVDYSGYAVLPMAIENDALIAIGQVKDSNLPAACLSNLNSSFEERTTPIHLEQLISETSVFKEHHWTNYFLASTQGLVKYYNDDIPNSSVNISEGIMKLVNEHGTICIVVSGTVPIGSGLSSSSSMVCSYTLAIMQLMKHQNIISETIFSRHQLASVSAKSERFIGVESGGMDQAISYLAKKEYAMRIDFHPILKATEVKLPENVTFVLCNSLVEHKLQSAASGIGYNVRVVECRLAAALLAHKANLPNKTTVRRLIDFEDEFCKSIENPISRLESCISAVKTYLHPENYSIEELKNLIPDENFESSYLGTVQSPEILKNLKLYDRAIHVFSEASRVLNFQKICADAETDASDQLGCIMNESHTSCRIDYECSCDELDKIVNYCIESGACGARLTGAGWGGWCIAMVDNRNIDKFIKNLSKYYNGDCSNFFATKPCSGSAILKY